MANLFRHTYCGRLSATVSRISLHSITGRFRTFLLTVKFVAFIGAKIRPEL